jgi:CRISPR-associated protein Csd1
MLLQRLVELAARLEEEGELPPPLYSVKPLRYVIELDMDGQLLNPQPIDLAEATGPNKSGRRQPLPNITRSVNIQPLLLADKADYTLGFLAEGGKAERVKQSHEAYLALLEACRQATGDPVVSAVAAFLAGDPLAQLVLPDGFDAGGNIGFRVGDTLAHNRPAVRTFWAEYLSPDVDKETPATCLVCGRERPALQMLPGKLKGVPGGQSSGTALVSANAEAFESYGLTRAQISPICFECADRLTAALNHLLADRANRVWFSSLVFVYWTQKPAPGFDMAAVSLEDPDPAAVEQLIRSVHTGQWDPDVDDTAYYAVSLSGSGGRAVVRDWIDTTVGRVKRSLAGWFAAQAVVDAWGEAGRPLGLYALAAATVRDPKDIIAATYGALLRGGMTGAPLPWNLLQRAVGRNHAERDVTRPRAALIKLVLTSQGAIEENTMTDLQPDHPNPAYQCGRLLAVLESIQRAALGDISATVVDRFYGTASTAPASVFGRLLRGAQPHMSKLRRDKPGTAQALQTRLEDVLRSLPDFPRTLSLKEQGLFALGYYHQRADDRAQARERAAARAEANRPTQQPAQS